MTVYLSINTHPPQKKTRNTRIYLKVVARVLWGSCNGFSLELLYLVVWFVVWFVYFSILFDRYAMVCYMSAFAPPKILRPKGLGVVRAIARTVQWLFSLLLYLSPPPKYSFLNPEKIWKIGGDDFVWGCLLYNNQFHNVWQVFYMSSPQKSFWHLHTCPGVGIGKVFNHTQQFF